MPGTPMMQEHQSNCSNEVGNKNLKPEDPQSVTQQRGDGDEEPAPPAREITQTDKLNKRLLVSFLNRMNSQTDNDDEDKQEGSSSNEKNDGDNDTNFE